MTSRAIARHLRVLIAAAAASAMLMGLLLGLPGTARAAGTLPCDVYGAAGTPCVAAYSTVRALFSSYDGSLYQVQRASDSATTNIGPMTTGGYANAASQDTFCAETTCTITEIYDQSSEHNNLSIEPAGAAGGANRGANAEALPAIAGGHQVYGLNIGESVGYRDDNGAGVATNGQAEGMYMVAGGKADNGVKSDDNCCWDFGNVESTETDNGASHMDAINFGTECTHPCAGVVPSIGADLENGIFGGTATNSSNHGNNSTFVTAMLKNDGQTTYALRGGNAQSGSLTTWYNGALPSGYAPMHQEGGIVLGTGGDNSNRGVGTFFEGAMTAGYPTDAVENSIQSNIVSVGYLGDNSGTITGANGKCVDVAGDDVGGSGAAAQIWDCQSWAADQHWYHNDDGSLTTLGLCLDTAGEGTTNGTLLQLAQCNGASTQQWQQQSDGALLNVGSGRCVDDPLYSSTNGTQLQIWDCNGVAQQEWSANAGNPITLANSKCVDVPGDDVGGSGSPVQIWDCQWWAADQHWYHNPNGSLSTLGLCLDTAGEGTTNGTLLQLANCNGASVQEWTQQGDGSLLNVGSGRCVDDPLYSSTDGTQLQIWDCNGAIQQKLALH